MDQINIDADVPGNSPAATTDAGRKDYAFYAETDIPIFSPTFSFPGFYSLNLTAAVRYEAFENNDTNVAVPKFGIRWQPLDETLTVRATIGEGFREPSLIELYASPTSALTGSQDILPGPADPVDLGGPATPVRIPDANGNLIPNPARFEPEQGLLSRAARSSSQRIHVPLAAVLFIHPSMCRDSPFRLTSGISSGPVS